MGLHFLHKKRKFFNYLLHKTFEDLKKNFKMAPAYKKVKLDNNKHKDGAMETAKIKISETSAEVTARKKSNSNVDIRNVRRGSCQQCFECDLYRAGKIQILCMNCDCPPVKHENLDGKNMNEDDGIHTSNQVSSTFL